MVSCATLPLLDHRKVMTLIRRAPIGARLPMRSRHAPPALLLSCAALLAGCGSSTPAPRSVAGPARAVRLTPRTIRVGGTPVAIAANAHAIWVADNSRGLVRRLDLATGRQIGEPTRVGRGPLAISAGEDGVWVATGAGTVQRLDPRTATADGPPIAVPDPNGIAAGGGSVWVTNRQASTVTRIDPRTGRVAGRPIPVGRTPADVAVGFGSVWVANVDDGTVSRLDARDGTAIGKPIPVSKAQVLGLTVDREGVWVATTDIRIGDRIEVRRIDPESGRLDARRAEVPAGVPSDIVAGLGRIWITDTGSVLPATARAPVVRALAPSKTTPDAAIPVGRDPRALALSSDAVWVASAGDGTVTRVAVAPR